MKKLPQYSPELKERAVRMVLDCEPEYNSRWSATCSVATKIGCTPETLRSWLKKSVPCQINADQSTADKLKALERENNELRRANEILRKAAAFFAQAELDRKQR